MAKVYCENCRWRCSTMCTAPDTYETVTIGANAMHPEMTKRKSCCPDVNERNKHNDCESFKKEPILQRLADRWDNLGGFPLVITVSVVVFVVLSLICQLFKEILT